MYHRRLRKNRWRGEITFHVLPTPRTHLSKRPADRLERIRIRPDSRPHIRPEGHRCGPEWGYLSGPAVHAAGRVIWILRLLHHPRSSLFTGMSDWAVGMNRHSAHPFPIGPTPLDQDPRPDREFRCWSSEDPGSDMASLLPASSPSILWLPRSTIQSVGDPVCRNLVSRC